MKKNLVFFFVFVFIFFFVFFFLKIFMENRSDELPTGEIDVCHDFYGFVCRQWLVENRLSASEFKRSWLTEKSKEIRAEFEKIIKNFTEPSRTIDFSSKKKFVDFLFVFLREKFSPSFVTGRNFFVEVSVEMKIIKRFVQVQIFSEIFFRESSIKIRFHSSTDRNQLLAETKPSRHRRRKSNLSEEKSLFKTEFKRTFP